MTTKDVHQGGQVQLRVYECGRTVTSHPTQTKIRDRLHHKTCVVCKNIKIDTSIPDKRYTNNLNLSIQTDYKKKSIDNI